MIVHVNLWPEQMNWMLNAFRAKVVQFRYYGDMPPLAD
jgi:hypothetical protein